MRPYRRWTMDCVQCDGVNKAGLNLAHGYTYGTEKNSFYANPTSNNSINDRLYRTGDFIHIDYDGRTDTQGKIIMKTPRDYSGLRLFWCTYSDLITKNLEIANFRKLFIACKIIYENVYCSDSQNVLIRNFFSKYILTYEIWYTAKCDMIRVQHGHIVAIWLMSSPHFFNQCFRYNWQTTFDLKLCIQFINNNNNNIMLLWKNICT